MKVLIAEDDETSSLILRRAVQKFGHEYILARDGLEAWELYSANEIDVVISDRDMPGIDGMELCRRIREAQTAYTYFIFLTAMTNRADVLEGMEAGADDYLTKPLIEITDLKARLIAAQRVTSLHRQLAQNRVELERLNDELFVQARRDPLTGLGNRLRLREDLEIIRGRVERYGHSYCAALCDIDSFKLYNDNYGHIPAGDEVLRAVAQTLAQHCRSGDVAYRYGGEEFLVLLPEQSLESALIAINRMRVAVEELGIPHEYKDPPGVVTFSAGVASLAGGEKKTIDLLLKEADIALYRAKEAGKNRVLAYE